MELASEGIPTPAETNRPDRAPFVKSSQISGPNLTLMFKKKVQVSSDSIKSSP